MNEQGSSLSTPGARESSSHYQLWPPWRIVPPMSTWSYGNLDKISEALGSRNRRRWSTVDPGALPVPTFSTAVGSPWSKPNTTHLIDDSESHRDFFDQPSKEERCTHSASAFLQERPRLNGHSVRLKNIDTPASITLRRASGVHAFQRTRGDCGLAKKSANPPSTTPDDSQEPKSWVASRLSQITSAVPRTCRPIPEQAQITDQNTQCGAVAETATTYADVHVFAPIFASAAVDKASTLSKDPLRRTSAVQIRSRSSVYEVIWRDDYSSSGKSSISHDSPPLDLHPVRALSDPIKGQNSRRPATGAIQNADGERQSTERSPEANSPASSGEHAVRDLFDLAKPRQTINDLFQWSWDTNSEQHRVKPGALLSFESRRPSATGDKLVKPSPAKSQVLTLDGGIESLPRFVDQGSRIGDKAAAVADPSDRQARLTGARRSLVEVRSTRSNFVIFIQGSV